MEGCAELFLSLGSLGVTVWRMGDTHGNLQLQLHEQKFQPVHTTHTLDLTRDVACKRKKKEPSFVSYDVIHRVDASTERTAGM